MRQLFPEQIDAIEALDIYPGAPRPMPPGRPWVMVNMIASIDGATAIEGLSGALGGPGDREVFTAIRASCDWILVASGTARAERYRIPRPSDAVRQARVDAGREPTPRLAVVSGSLRLETDLPMLAERSGDESPALIITGTDSPAERRRQLETMAEVLVLDEPRPTPGATIAALAERGACVVLVEGGPGYNSQMASAGLIDEMCVSVSPRLAGGDSGRMLAAGPPVGDLEFELAHLLEHDSMLFARYLRR